MRGRRNSHSMPDLDLGSVVEACCEEPAFAPSSCPIDQKKESDARNKRKRQTHAFSDSSVERREKKSKAAAGGSVEEANRKEEDRQKGLRSPSSSSSDRRCDWQTKAAKGLRYEAEKRAAIAAPVVGCLTLRLTGNLHFWWRFGLIQLTGKCTRKNQEVVALFGLDVTANHFGGTLAEICEEEKGKKKQFWISDFIIVLQFQSTGRKETERGCCHLDVHRKW
ncbi:unnamed protein product [Lactuca saligna]|uniref:Uncharacterized protein n=1 Tax=Lactuca saligna TaxID=75948 RepID=A0AA35VBD3_LACSI|nr:unnamed protein product [Lactuca saligna]